MDANVNPPARTRARRQAGSAIRILRGPTTGQDHDDVLQSVTKGDYASHQVTDPFQTNKLYEAAGSDFRILPPPVNLAALMRMPNDNSILRQCIEAMVINIEGHGHRLEYVGPDGEDQSDAALTERNYIEDFLPTLHPDLSLVELRKRIRWDIETLGFSYLEVGRSRDRLPIFLSHIPGHTMRMTTVDMTDVPIKVGGGSRFGKLIEGQIIRRFRRFVQIVGTKKVYFKEFGDPRDIDPTDGVAAGTLDKGSSSVRVVSYEDSATEVIFIAQYYPGQSYGLPRWFNNLVAIQGSRQAELTNLDYFKENAIPAMAVLVSGGSLAHQTIQQIDDHVTAARGRAAMNRVIIIEVEGDENAASKDGVIPAPKVELRPLAGERVKEGMFLEYDKSQTDKVRSSFRLPPIFTGHSQDYTRASAQTSYEVAEGQVFGPERAYLDDIINRQILAPYGVKFWAIRSNPPRISDPDAVISAIEAFNNVGAMTPNVAIGLANEQFGLDIPMIEENWGNFPFPIVEALATQGKLLGFEDILKEVEDNTRQFDADGNPINQNDPNPDDPAQDDNEATSDNEKAKAVRRVMASLRDVLQSNENVVYQARDTPRAKRRAKMVSLKKQGPRPPSSGHPWIDPSSPPPQTPHPR